MKYTIAALTAILIGAVVDSQVLKNAEKEVRPSGYDIPEGVDPDKPFVVHGQEFDLKLVYSKEPKDKKSAAISN